jgi:hypothetical protein
MKYITLLQNKFLPKQSTILLGRWNIVYCDKKINKKIDLSNEDHCGACDIYKYDIYKYDKYKDINLNKLIFYETM